jgi:hypothetical protein
LYHERIVRPKTADKQADRYKKLIKAYCDKLAAMETIPMPDDGDCWYCYMREVKTGKTLGECTGDTYHLVEHLKKQYIHGSLIMNALVAAGYRDPGLVVHMDLRSNIVRAVRRYFKRALGLVA